MCQQLNDAPAQPCTLACMCCLVGPRHYKHCVMLPCDFHKPLPTVVASQRSGSWEASELPPGLVQIIVLLVQTDRLGFKGGLQDGQAPPLRLPVPLLLPQLLAPQLPHNLRAAM